MIQYLIPHFLIPMMIFAACVSTSALAGGSARNEAPGATAQLKTAGGENVGTVKFFSEEDGNKVRLEVDVKGITPGKHGFHIHEKGQCTAPDFTSAGGHFNPTGHQHGLKNPKGSHAGDFDNIEVGSDGSVKTTLNTDRISLKKGVKNSVFKEGGTAVVIHATADDQKSDPAGNAGGRIACGVIQ